MESKDMPYGNYSLVQTRSKRLPPLLDSSTFARSMNDEYPPDSATSSPCSTIRSPLSPASTQPSCPASEYSDARESEANKELVTGSHRARLSSTVYGKGEKDKRKRSRVTPDQLVHLERFFAVDRSPTAARRREISELLGMQERQTQIWFQNRRAKAKLQDGRNKRRSGSADTPPDTPPELSTGFEVELHNLIHEDEPVTIIPCTDLSIGTWRRIASTVGKHDLVAYVCDAKRCLTWFIHSEGYGFKMEIPFDSISDMEFKNAAPGSGLALFVLSQPPAFYLENVSSPRPDGSLVRHWKRCADWTEGQQATKVLRHELVGSAVQLAHVLRNLRASTPGPDIRLRSPSYQRPPESPQTPLDLPRPPLTALGSSDFQYRCEFEREDQTSSRKRSYSGPPMTTRDPPSDVSGFPSIEIGAREALTHGPPSASFPSSPYPQVQSAHRIESSSHYTSPIIPGYSAPEPQTLFAHPRDSLAGYAPPQQVNARSFTVQSLARDFYDEVSPVSPYPSDASQHHASLHQPPFAESPSPPLDMQYSQQGLSLDCTNSPHELDAPGAIISNLSGVSYDDESVLYAGRGTGLTQL